MTSAGSAGVRTAWPLDDDIVFLNHGSFGACPTAVLEHQRSLTMRLEREPVRFFVRELEPLWDAARESLASFVGCDPDDLVSVPNATAGVNAVLRSLKLSPGDELLITNQAYPACRNAVEATCEQTGGRPVIVSIPFPAPEDDELIERVLSCVSNHTRFAIIDHVASPTGTIMPVERLCPALQERGVLVLIDGAHAPGMLPIQLSELGADYYVGNCHKWMCAPKGAGFLHVMPRHQDSARPLAVSLGYKSARRDRSSFLVAFGWTGTQDPTAFLTVPFAIDYVSSLHPNGWPGIRAHNHALVTEGSHLVAASLGLDKWNGRGSFGSMVALPLPPRIDAAPEPPQVLDTLQDWLYDEHGIEVPIVTWPTHPNRLIRLSAHIYTLLSEFELLADALRTWRASRSAR